MSMTNTYQAEVVALDEDVEEHVVLSIQGIQLVCFAGVCPYRLQEGASYPVELRLTVLDDYEVTEAEQPSPGFTRMGDGFGYHVRGKLHDDTIDAGIVFQDDVLLSDYGFLEGKYVSMKVDRIDVEFLDPQRSNR
jgi:hypothetical protein